MNRTLKITLLLILCFGLAAAVFANGDGEDDQSAAKVDVSFPYTGEEVVFTYFSEGTEEGTLAELEKPVWKAIQESIGNIRIDKISVTKDEEDTRLSLMYATGLEFDMTYCREPLVAVPPIAATGILLNFSDYSDYMPNLKKAAMKYPMLDMMVDADGGRYALHNANTGDRPYLLTAANTTYFDSMNQSLPIKTSDDWLDAIAEQQAADPNTVSVGDIWSGSWNITWVIGGMFNAGRGVQFWGYDDGWYYGPGDADHGFKETLMWMNQCYEIGGFHEEWLTYTLDQYTAFMQEGNWGVMDTYLYAFSANDGTGPRKDLADYDVEYFTIPKGPTGANEAMGGAFFDGAPYDGVIANSETANPEILAGMLDLMYSDTIVDLHNWGIKDVTYVDGADGRREWAPGFLPTPEAPETTKVFGDYFTGHVFMRATRVDQIGPALSKSYNQYSYHLIEKWASELAAGNMTGARVSWTGDTIPTVKPEESERAGEEMAPIVTHVKEQMVLFMLGERDFSEWDDFQAEIRSMGDLDWVINLYDSYPAPEVLERDWENYFN